MSHSINVTDESFEQEVLSSPIPVLLDFWAEWCAPCRVVIPILDQLSAEFSGKLKICKIDVDANPDTAAKYNVRGIPTLMLFEGGNLKSNTTGALSRQDIERFVSSVL